MKVYRLKHTNIESLSQINYLLSILNPNTPSIRQERLNEIIGDDSFCLLVAESENGNIDGMLTLTRCHTLGQSKYWIEDVVVHPDSRGQGIGRALVKHAVSHVRENEENAAIYLTSNPSRLPARALYRSEGFEEYATGVFRINI